MSAVTVIRNGKINAFTSISVTGVVDYSLTPISSERGGAPACPDKSTHQAVRWRTARQHDVGETKLLQWKLKLRALSGLQTNPAPLEADYRYV